MSYSILCQNLEKYLYLLFPLYSFLQLMFFLTVIGAILYKLEITWRTNSLLHVRNVHLMCLVLKNDAFYESAMYDMEYVTL